LIFLLLIDWTRHPPQVGMETQISNPSKGFFNKSKRWSAKPASRTRESIQFDSFFLQQQQAK